MSSNFICFEFCGSFTVARERSQRTVQPCPYSFRFGGSFIPLCFCECLLVSVLIHGRVSVKNQHAGEPGTIVSACHSPGLDGVSDLCRGERTERNDEGEAEAK